MCEGVTDVSLSYRAAANAALRSNYHGNIDNDEHHQSSDEDNEEALQHARQWDEFKDGNVSIYYLDFIWIIVIYRTSEGRRQQKEHGLIF